MLHPPEILPIHVLRQAPGPPPQRSILTPRNFFQVWRLTKASRQKPLKTDAKSKWGGPGHFPHLHGTRFTNARLLLSDAKHFGNSYNDSDFHRNRICTPPHSRTHGTSRVVWEPRWRIIVLKSCCLHLQRKEKTWWFCVWKNDATGYSKSDSKY